MARGEKHPSILSTSEIGFIEYLVWAVGTLIFNSVSSFDLAVLSNEKSAEPLCVGESCEPYLTHDNPYGSSKSHTHTHAHTDGRVFIISLHTVQSKRQSSGMAHVSVTFNINSATGCVYVHVMRRTRRHRLSDMSSVSQAFKHVGMRLWTLAKPCFFFCAPPARERFF